MRVRGGTPEAITRGAAVDLPTRMAHVADAHLGRGRGDMREIRGRYREDIGEIQGRTLTLSLTLPLTTHLRAACERSTLRDPLQLEGGPGQG